MLSQILEIFLHRTVRKKYFKSLVALDMCLQDVYEQSSPKQLVKNVSMKPRQIQNLPCLRRPYQERTRKKSSEVTGTCQ